MDILNKYPIAKAEFISWFTNRYMTGKNTFENAPFVQQCIALSRCFGYRIDLENWPKSKLEDHINNILYLYEDVMTRYPDGVPDIIKKMQQMNFAEREKEFGSLDKPADITHGLNEAIISLAKKIAGKHNRLSLQDAIVMTRSVIQKPVVDDDYWTPDKFNNNEKVPF